MVQVPVRNAIGETAGEIEVIDKVFAVRPNEAVVHQALVRQLANRRQGTADTKTRGEVAGGGAKIRIQKGSGRARQGQIRAPHHRGGGVVFGPHPRSFSQAMPKKMRHLALRSVLSAKAAEGELVVVDGLEFQEPKTKEMVRLLGVLGVATTALIVTAEVSVNVYKSARNIPGVKTLPVASLNLADLLSHKVLIMTVAAVRKVEEVWGPKESEVVQAG